MKNYYLSVIRHGLTQANFDGMYAGAKTDLPLCEKGREQLLELKKRFEYPAAEAVFCSPLERAVETAEILYPGVRRFAIEDLRELDFGEFEGKKAADLVGNAAYRRWLDPKEEYTPQGGENGNVFAARTRAVFLHCFEFMMKAGIFEAVCITHGGVAMSMLAQRALPERPAAQWACDAGCGYRLACNPEMLMRDGYAEALSIVPYGYADEPEGPGYALVEKEESEEPSEEDGAPE